MATIPTFPLLESRSVEELRAYALQRAFEVSNGRLKDSTPGSALADFVNYTVALFGEMGTALNNFPERMLLEWSELIGVVGATGTQAIGTVKVTLDAQYSTLTVVPKGFDLTINGVAFETSALLTIPAYVSSATVGIIALDIGTRGNITKDAAVSFQFLDRIATIALTEDTNGGNDADSLDTLALRTAVAIRARSLVGIEDFKDATELFLGTGSIAIAVRALAKDRVSKQDGAVHVFALNADTSELTQTQQAALQTNLALEAGWAIVHVSTIDVIDLEVFATVQILPGVDPVQVGQNVNTQLRSYLSPKSLPIGDSISVTRIIRELFKVADVDNVGQVSISPSLPGRDYPMPNAYSVGNLKLLRLKVVIELTTYEYNFTT